MSERRSDNPNKLCDIARGVLVTKARFPIMSDLRMTQAFQKIGDNFLCSPPKDNATAADVITNYFRTRNQDIRRPAARLIVSNHPLIEGWTEVDKAYLLDCALGMEADYYRKEIGKIERRRFYYGLDETDKENLQGLQNGLRWLESDQQRVRQSDNE